MLDPAGTQVATEIVEYGPVVRPDELETFGTAYSYLLGGSEAVVLAGSLPRDVPEDWYATALREARRQRVYAVLDSEGEPLRLGLGGEPDLDRAQPDGGRGARRLRVRERRRISCVALEQIVEMGARGVVITRDDGALALRARVGPPALPARHGAAARGRLAGRAPAMRCWRASWPRAAPSARSPTRCATPSPAVPPAPSTSSPECSIPARCSGFRRSVEVAELTPAQA